MERKVILQLHAKYQEAIEKLGNVPLTYNATIEGMGYKREILEAAQADIQKFKPSMNFYQFLCHVSSLYLVSEWRKYDQNLEGFAKVLVMNNEDAYCYFRAVIDGLSPNVPEVHDAIVAITSLELASEREGKYFDDCRKLCTDRLQELRLLDLTVGKKPLFKGIRFSCIIHKP